MIAELSRRAYSHACLFSSVSVAALTSYSLSKYMVDHRHGKVVENEDETKVMLNLVQEYGSFTEKDRNIELSNGLNGLESKSHGGEVVVRGTR